MTSTIEMPALRAEVEPALAYAAVCAQPAPSAADRMLATRELWGDHLTPIGRYTPIEEVMRFIARPALGTEQTLRNAAEHLRKTPHEIDEWAAEVAALDGCADEVREDGPGSPPPRRAATKRRQAEPPVEEEALPVFGPPAPPRFIRVDWRWTTAFFRAKKARMEHAYKALVSHTTLREARGLLPRLIAELTTRTQERSGNALAVHVDAATGTARLEPWLHAAIRAWTRTGQQLHLLAATQTAVPEVDPEQLVADQFKLTSDFEKRPDWDAGLLQFWSFETQLASAKKEFERVVATARSAMPAAIGDALPQATIARERWLVEVTKSGDGIYDAQYAPATPSGAAFKAFAAGKLTSQPLTMCGAPWARVAAAKSAAPFPPAKKAADGIDGALDQMRRMNGAAQRADGAPAFAAGKPHDASCVVCKTSFARTSPQHKRCRQCSKANAKPVG
jgi:hypothetical protein